MADETAIVAGGCFWCTEAIYLDVVGVKSVESGYIGGDTVDPTYNQVCGGDTGHAEAVKLVFDPAQIALPDLLDIFFATHDPTQLNRQGNDVGTQYRSAIFPLDEEQEADGRAGIERAQADQQAPIVTTIEPGATWYPAEGNHQDYWATQGQRNPYCMAIIPPKLAKLRKSFGAKVKGETAEKVLPDTKAR